ncbi:hypothetical protein BB561_004033 [Smittium simulii]|uniref:UDP-glucose:glycoprotein glucosyltransferase n=1 Tax=Smittium simulii TaxID=133385 RepID=A0A2T9YIG8_9FUNG|nr:hypothetical protein BB561_004033 [Smittium simulii]
MFKTKPNSILASLWFWLTLLSLAALFSRINAESQKILSNPDVSSAQVDIINADNPIDLTNDKNYSTPPVKAIIRAPFSAPNILIELSQVIYKHDKTLFFNFIKHLNQNLDLFEKTDKDAYNAAISWIEIQLNPQIVKKNIKPDTKWLLSVINFELANHHEVPKIIAQYQYYSELVSEKFKADSKNIESSRSNYFKNGWVSWNGKSATNFNELEALVGTDTFYGDTYKDKNLNKSPILSFDHIYPAKTGNPTKIAENLAIFYSNLKEKDFGKIHDYLLHLSNLGNTVYVLRFIPDNPDVFQSQISKSSMGISGYSVELALKSTEYNVTNESSLFDIIDSEPEGSGSEWDFNLNKYNTVQTNMDKSKYLNFYDKQSSVTEDFSDDEKNTMSLKATQVILNSKSPIDMFNWIVSDFPKYAKFVSSQSSLKNLTYIAALRESSIETPLNEISLNGLVLKKKNLNIFSLINHIETERKAVVALMKLGFTTSQATGFISAPRNFDKNSKVNSGVIAYDVRDNSESKVVISWLNNLEKDSRYKTWSSNANIVYTIQSTGAAPLIARNILNVVVALDINTRFGIRLLFDTVFDSIKKNLPVRFGIIPILSSGSHTYNDQLKVCECSSISEALDASGGSKTTKQLDSPEMTVRLYYYVYHFYGIKKLSELFESIIKNAKSDHDIAKVAKSSYNSVIIKQKAQIKEKKVLKMISTLFPKSKKEEIDDFTTKFQSKYLEWDQLLSCPIVSAIMCKHRDYTSRLDLNNLNNINDLNQSKKDKASGDKTIKDVNSIVKIFASGYELSYSKDLINTLTRMYQQTCILLFRKMFMGFDINGIKDFFTYFLTEGNLKKYRSNLISSVSVLDGSVSETQKINKNTMIGVLDFSGSVDTINSKNDTPAQWINELLYIEQPQIKEASSESVKNHPLTIWIYTNLESEAAKKVIKESLQAAQQLLRSKSTSNFRVRLSLFHNLKAQDSNRNNKQKSSDDIDSEDGADDENADENTDLQDNFDNVTSDDKNNTRTKLYLLLSHFQKNQENSSSDNYILSLQYIIEYLENLDIDGITGELLIKKSSHEVDVDVANNVVSEFSNVLNNISEKDLLEINQYYLKSYQILSSMIVKYGARDELEYILRDEVSGDETAIIINGRAFPKLTASSYYNAEIAINLFKDQWENRVMGSQKLFNHLFKESENLLTRQLQDLYIVSGSIVDYYHYEYAFDDFIFNKISITRKDIFEEIYKSKETRFDIGNTDNYFAHFKAVIDPLSDDSQDWVPLLQTLSKMDGVKVSIVLNPLSSQNLQLRKFKRYVISHKPIFSSSKEGNRIELGAEFNDMPKDALLTMGMDVPSSWLVTAVSSKYDLDNINLRSIKSKYGVAALFSLKYVLIEGHASEPNKKAPPSGIQVSLSKLPASMTPSIENLKKKSNQNFDIYLGEIAKSPNDTLAGTIVMENLGYLQLKTHFGAYGFSVREGRSLKLFDLDCIGVGAYSDCLNNAGATEAQPVEDSLAKNYGIVVLDSFNGATVYPFFSKRKGMEDEPILLKELSKESGQDQKASDLNNNQLAGIWSKIKSFGSGVKAKNQINTDLDYSEEAQLNIFVVASGHLYERLMSIMIVSVMKNTKSTVKFWIIENFMSPAFKAFMPILAQNYNFKYEMITYKWPHWLNSEKEKQRTIWGYKILFLDVLFPLGLKRVIYVDADQIVRDDLQKLYDMDLKGAPYGYVPFCDDKKEIDGYRFWKVGYWKSHLQGKPYHISALYVVDLVQFRLLAAGDILRFQYQNLSQDKNSLANLDQDLPNHLQHSVPIFSLPQEWLWCETWCSEEGLKNAKTIDLCNNPMTKEPKLKRAKRIIEEWSIYDKEIEDIKLQNSKHSSVNGPNSSINESKNPEKVEL